MRRQLPSARRSLAPLPAARCPLPRRSARRSPGAQAAHPVGLGRRWRGRCSDSRGLRGGQEPRRGPSPSVPSFCGSGGSRGAPPEPQRQRARPSREAAGWGAAGVGRGEEPLFRPCLVSALAVFLLLFSSLPSKSDPITVPILSLSLPLPSLPGWGLRGCGPRSLHPVAGERAERGGSGAVGRTTEEVSKAVRGLSPSLRQEGGMALAQDGMGRGRRWEGSLGGVVSGA